MFEAGQAPAAEVQLKRALLTYDRLGATWDHARAARLARQRGVALARRHGGGRRSYGTELSPQERAVAELAALGHTNKEIAAKLFISYGTVDKHMRSIMRKKGARSRTELAYRLASGDYADASKDGEITP
jgi:DNA-binding NarL/FixJ family response regulator